MSLKLLLWLLLLLPACAQSEGMLVRLVPGEAELSGHQIIPLDHTTYRKLAERGLGSLWKIFVQRGRVDSTLYEGMAEGVPSALRVLSQFIAAIEGSQWEQARQLVAPELRPTEAQFAESWGTIWLSNLVEDWQLEQAEPQRVTVRVAGSRSRGSRVGRSGYRAARQSFRFTLVPTAGVWQVHYSPP